MALLMRQLYLLLVSLCLWLTMVDDSAKYSSRYLSATFHLAHLIHDIDERLCDDFYAILN